MKWLGWIFPWFLVAAILWVMIAAAMPRHPREILLLTSTSSATGSRVTLTPDNCRVMAEHLRQDHHLKVRVLSGVQITRGAFVWQDLTLELVDHPGFVFSYPHYLGNLHSQEVLEEDR